MYSLLLHLPNYLFYYAVSGTDVVFNDEIIYCKTPRSFLDFSGGLRAAMKDLPCYCVFVDLHIIPGRNLNRSALTL